MSLTRFDGIHKVSRLVSEASGDRSEMRLWPNNSDSKFRAYCNPSSDAIPSFSFTKCVRRNISEGKIGSPSDMSRASTIADRSCPLGINTSRISVTV